MLGRLCWSLALLAALLWPARLVWRLDGLPLDRPLEAALVGILLPAVWMLHPGFLSTHFAKAGIIALLGWKIVGATLLSQGGWCGVFSRYHPSPEAARLQPSWDVRTYAGPSHRTCSAIVARPYDSLREFPAWSVNIPLVDTVATLGTVPMLAVDSTRPPDGRYRLTLTGALHAPHAGMLSFELGEGVRFEGTVDGREFPGVRGNRVTAPLDAGEHTIRISLDLSGDGWRFVPRWNERALFTTVPTGLRAGEVTGGFVARWGRLVPAVLILVLLGAWAVSTIRALRPTAGIIAWCIGSVLGAGVLAGTGSVGAQRWGLLALVVAAFIPVPSRLRNWRGALLLVGLPWLSLFAIRSFAQIGQFTLFSVGDDWLRFQRFAHRIFMEQYWLEGGEPAFFFQPLYRWTTGLLHLLFGDSSVGDLYWDVFGLLVGAIFAFQVARRYAGFRAGVVTASMVLATIAVGPNWHWIGRGLSEISAAAWLFLAALSLLAARRGGAGYAILAGLFAVLGFYTRLNHLPLVVALVALALPDEVPAGSVWHWRLLWSRIPRRIAFTYLACVTVGMALFAIRTWYYTGELSILDGTSLSAIGTGLGRNLKSLWSTDAWGRALESVMMIVVVRDPPRFDPRSVLVVVGVLCALLGLLGAPGLRRLPLHLTVVCIGALAGGLVARGNAYSGRFSIHLIPIAATVAVCAASLLTAGRMRGSRAWPGLLLDGTAAAPSPRARDTT